MKMENDQLLIDKFLDHHPARAVDAIEKLSIHEIATLIEGLSTDKSRIVLANMPAFKAAKVLEHVSKDYKIKIFASIPLKIAESILRGMDKQKQQETLNQLPKELGSNLKRVLVYNKKQIGAHIKTDILVLFEDYTIERALTEIKKGVGSTKPTLFVINKARELLGYVEVNELVARESNKPIRSIMKIGSSPIIANMFIKDALENWDDSFTELPVVKVNGLFLGTVTRVELSKLGETRGTTGKLEIKTGNALGDLYLIGLTSLLGNPEQNLKS